MSCPSPNTGVECPEHGHQHVTHMGPQTVTLTCGGTGSGGVYIHVGEAEKAARVAQHELLVVLLHEPMTLEGAEHHVKFALAALDSAHGRLDQ